MKKVFDNKKLLLGFLTMVVILAIIVVSSFWPFILDLSRVGTTEFITDQMFIMAITISVTISMMFIAQVSNAQNPNSELAKAKVEFMNSIKKIVNHTWFYQWIKRVLQPNDRKDIAEKGMLKLDVPFAVYELSDTEIRSLEKPQKFGDTFYKSLTKKQIEGVLSLKKQVANIKFVSPNYYTSFKSWMIDKNLSEIASGENKKKIFTVIFRLTLKIVMSFIFAAILASLVRDIAQEGGSTAQAWMRFLSRMFAFITSSFLGFTLGCKLNDLDAFYITKRVEAHTLYLEDKNFKPIDEAKQEFIERVLNEEHSLIGQDAHLIEHKGDE
jgi:hypothetical protein